MLGGSNRIRSAGTPRPSSLFANVAQSVTIGAGREAGIRYGQPVFGGGGLFGRIVSVGEKRARVLMLNDNASRIAVEVGEGRQPALVVGDDSARPRLVYLKEAEAIEVGAKVVTSGASGAFARGILVGHVAGGGDVMRVAPLSSLVAGRYLTVMKYALPGPPGETAEDGGAASGGQQGAQWRERAALRAVGRRGVGHAESRLVRSL